MTDNEEINDPLCQEEAEPDESKNDSSGIRAKSRQELRELFVAWYQDSITAHSVMGRWIKELGQEVDELRVPTIVMYCQLKAWVKSLELNELAVLDDGRRYLLDVFTDFIVEDIEKNRQKFKEEMDKAIGEARLHQALSQPKGFIGYG